MLFNVDHAIDENNELDLIKKYHKLRYTQEEILQILKRKRNIEINLRALQRILKENNLKKKYLEESPIKAIAFAIHTEFRISGMNLGYRFMWQRLRDKYGLVVKQTTVLRLMNIMDPVGIEARSRYRLKRRIYKTPGPNHLWHIDGYC